LAADAKIEDRILAQYTYTVTVYANGKSIGTYTWDPEKNSYSRRVGHSSGKGGTVYSNEYLVFKDGKWYKAETSNPGKGGTAKTTYTAVTFGNVDTKMNLHTIKLNGYFMKMDSKLYDLLKELQALYNRLLDVAAVLEGKEKLQNILEQLLMGASGKATGAFSQVIGKASGSTIGAVTGLISDVQENIDKYNMDLYETLMEQAKAEGNKAEAGWCGDDEEAKRVRVAELQKPIMEAMAKVSQQNADVHKDYIMSSLDPSIKSMIDPNNIIHSQDVMTVRAPWGNIAIPGWKIFDTNLGAAVFILSDMIAMTKKLINVANSAKESILNVMDSMLLDIDIENSKAAEAARNGLDQKADDINSKTKKFLSKMREVSSYYMQAMHCIDIINDWSQKDRSIAYDENAIKGYLKSYAGIDYSFGKSDSWAKGKFTFDDFSLLDIDGNGSLSEQELKNSRVPQETINAMRRYGCFSSDPTKSREGFRKYLRTEGRKDDWAKGIILKSDFELLDLNGNKEVSADELRAFGVDPKTISEMGTYGTKGKKWNEEQFSRYVETKQLANAIANGRDFQFDDYKLLDINNDGKISTDEMNKMFDMSDLWNLSTSPYLNENYRVSKPGGGDMTREEKIEWIKQKREEVIKNYGNRSVNDYKITIRKHDWSMGIFYDGDYELLDKDGNGLSIEELKDSGLDYSSITDLMDKYGCFDANKEKGKEGFKQFIMIEFKKTQWAKGIFTAGDASLLNGMSADDIYNMFGIGRDVLYKYGYLSDDKGSATFDGSKGDSGLLRYSLALKRREDWAKGIVYSSDLDTLDMDGDGYITEDEMKDSGLDAATIDKLKKYGSKKDNIAHYFEVQQKIDSWNKGIFYQYDYQLLDTDRDGIITKEELQDIGLSDVIIKRFNDAGLLGHNIDSDTFPFFRFARINDWQAGKFNYGDLREYAQGSKILDVNGDKQITEEDLTLMNIPQSVIDEIKKIASDNNISFENALKMRIGSSITQTQRDNWKKGIFAPSDFDLIDTDGDGDLDREELEAIGIEAFSDLDSKWKFCTKEKFETLISIDNRSKDWAAGYLNSLDYSRLDINGDGLLTSGELSKAGVSYEAIQILKNYGVVDSNDPIKAHKMFEKFLANLSRFDDWKSGKFSAGDSARLDLNGDEELSYDELLASGVPDSTIDQMETYGCKFGDAYDLNRYLIICGGLQSWNSMDMYTQAFNIGNYDYLDVDHDGVVSEGDLRKLNISDSVISQMDKYDVFCLDPNMSKRNFARFCATTSVTGNAIKALNGFDTRMNQVIKALFDPSQTMTKNSDGYYSINEAHFERMNKEIAKMRDAISLIYVVTKSMSKMNASLLYFSSGKMINIHGADTPTEALDSLNELFSIARDKAEDKKNIENYNKERQERIDAEGWGILGGIIGAIVAIALIIVTGGTALAAIGLIAAGIKAGMSVAKYVYNSGHEKNKELQEEKMDNNSMLDPNDADNYDDLGGGYKEVKFEKLVKARLELQKKMEKQILELIARESLASFKDMLDQYFIGVSTRTSTSRVLSAAINSSFSKDSNTLDLAGSAMSEIAQANNRGQQYEDMQSSLLTDMIVNLVLFAVSYATLALSAASAAGAETVGPLTEVEQAAQESLQFWSDVMQYTSSGLNLANTVYGYYKSEGDLEDKIDQLEKLGKETSKNMLNEAANNLESKNDDMSKEIAAEMRKMADSDLCFFKDIGGGMIGLDYSAFSRMMRRIDEIIGAYMIVLAAIEAKKGMEDEIISDFGGTSSASTSLSYIKQMVSFNKSNTLSQLQSMYQAANTYANKNNEVERQKIQMEDQTTMFWISVINQSLNFTGSLMSDLGVWDNARDYIKSMDSWLMQGYPVGPDSVKEYYGLNWVFEKCQLDHVGVDIAKVNINVNEFISTAISATYADLLADWINSAKKQATEDSRKTANGASSSQEITDARDSMAAARSDAQNDAMSEELAVKPKNYWKKVLESWVDYKNLNGLVFNKATSVVGIASLSYSGEISKGFATALAWINDQFSNAVMISSYDVAELSQQQKGDLFKPAVQRLGPKGIVNSNEQKFEFKPGITETDIENALATNPPVDNKVSAFLKGKLAEVNARQAKIDARQAEIDAMPITTFDISNKGKRGYKMIYNSIQTSSSKNPFAGTVATKLIPPSEISASAALFVNNASPAPVVMVFKDSVKASDIEALNGVSNETKAILKAALSEKTYSTTFDTLDTPMFGWGNSAAANRDANRDARIQSRESRIATIKSSTRPPMDLEIGQYITNPTAYSFYSGLKDSDIQEILIEVGDENTSGKKFNALLDELVKEYNIKNGKTDNKENIRSAKATLCEDFINNKAIPFSENAVFYRDVNASIAQAKAMASIFGGIDGNISVENILNTKDVNYNPAAMGYTKNLSGGYDDSSGGKISEEAMAKQIVKTYISNSNTNHVILGKNIDKVIDSIFKVINSSKESNIKGNITDSNGAPIQIDMHKADVIADILSVSKRFDSTSTTPIKKNAINRQYENVINISQEGQLLQEFLDDPNKLYNILLQPNKSYVTNYNTAAELAPSYNPSVNAKSPLSSEEKVALDNMTEPQLREKLKDQIGITVVGGNKEQLETIYANMKPIEATLSQALKFSNEVGQDKISKYTLQIEDNTTRSRVDTDNNVIHLASKDIVDSFDPDISAAKKTAFYEEIGHMVWDVRDLSKTISFDEKSKIAGKTLPEISAAVAIDQKDASDSKNNNEYNVTDMRTREMWANMFAYASLNTVNGVTTISPEEAFVNIRDNDAKEVLTTIAKDISHMLKTGFENIRAGGEEYDDNKKNVLVSTLPPELQMNIAPFVNITPDLSLGKAVEKMPLHDKMNFVQNMTDYVEYLTSQSIKQRELKNAGVEGEDISAKNEISMAMPNTEASKEDITMYALAKKVRDNALNAQKSSSNGETPAIPYEQLKAIQKSLVLMIKQVSNKLADQTEAKELLSEIESEGFLTTESDQDKTLKAEKTLNKAKEFIFKALVDNQDIKMPSKIKGMISEKITEAITAIEDTSHNVKIKSDADAVLKAIKNNAKPDIIFDMIRSNNNSAEKVLKFLPAMVKSENKELSFKVGQIIEYVSKKMDISVKMSKIEEIERQKDDLVKTRQNYVEAMAYQETQIASQIPMINMMVKEKLSEKKNVSFGIDNEKVEVKANVSEPSAILNIGFNAGSDTKDNKDEQKQNDKKTVPATEKEKLAAQKENMAKIQEKLLKNHSSGTLS